MNPLGFAQDRRELRVAFLDLNAYFASVEQQEDPKLRGRPVVVAPMLSDATCAIAASYEAKAFGIKTGTKIGDAKRMCPDLVVLGATPTKYVNYHHRVLEAVGNVLPVDKVCSIDEMQFRLLGIEKDPVEARRIGIRLKEAIRDGVGDQMRCSVGVAPNAFLAKVGTELEKPDGLVILQGSDLPDRLKSLKLTDFPGINRRMKARLQASGIFTTEQMLDCTAVQLRDAFGSVIGERWWYLLRGFELDLKVNEQQSLSHSHVLAPEFRTDDGCWKVILRLTQKAAARLRSNGWFAQSVSVFVRGKSRNWESRRRISAMQDSVHLTEVIAELWESRNFDTPILAGVVFGGLANRTECTPSLFDDHPEWDDLSRAVDSMNQKFGKNAIFLAALNDAKDSADEKIAFNKTWLFSEGKGDNELEDLLGSVD